MFYALSATLCFAYASTIFTDFSRKLSPFWVNSVKAFVGFIAFWLTVAFSKNWVALNLQALLTFLFSGCIGLMIGDIFMLHAMKELGASRMLMIFGLQPFFLGITGHYFFNQNFSAMNFLGIIFMLLCLYTISLENYKKNGHWQLRGMLLGLIAVLLDSVGVLLTKHGFNSAPGISSAEANAIRALGAILGFFIINYFYYPKNQRIFLKINWSQLSKGEKRKIILGSLAGTYFSLMLYLFAISKGQLSVISSVTVTGPMFAVLFECAKTKKWPTPYTFIAFFFFTAGFIIFSKL